MEKEETEGLYVPVACFITSYAREVTQRTAQKIYDYSMKKYGKNYYIYSDTDSIHTLLSIEELQQFCKIDDNKLGYWAFEEFCTKGKYIRQKCYIHEVDKKIDITCAGMPEKCYSQVNWDNFKEELTVRWKINI